jgi:hypothetical protein
MAKQEKQESKRATAKSWQSKLDAYSKAFEKWEKTGEQIIKRYRDERDTLNTKKRRFNILWSNEQVLMPALYGRAAKPEVSRRFKDGDTVGRVGASIVERALEFDVEENADFDRCMRSAVEDRLLPGRGIGWIRYEAGISQVQVTNEVSEKVDYECAPIDYVNWRDFRHSPARTWDEVWWVARCVWMTREEGKKRFGDVFVEVPLEYEDNTKTGTAEELPKESQDQKAKVWEIWDKKKKEVIWIADGFKIELDRKADPLKLDEFFPCPRPLYATTTTGSLIPVPDYTEYQDQAEELDTLTQRIHLLTRALKVAGVYNGEFKELQRLLQEGVDNTMIGVSAWAAFAEKGGMEGAVTFLPIKEIAEVIVHLTNIRQQVLTDVWQIMGLSDIMRGSTDADETLGAQEMKAQFGSMRLKVVQGDVARFASDIFRLKAEVMCKHFDPQTLIEMSGAEFLPEAQQPELIAQAIALLKEGRLKDFRIQVESDSLAQIDEAAEKKETAEFITSMGAILKEAGPVVQVAPTMLPFVGELMLLAARKQRVGRAVEMALEQSLQATQQKMAQGQPDPAQLQQMQQEIQKKGEEVRKGEMALEAKGQKVQMDEQMAAQSIEMKQQKMIFEIEKARDKAIFDIDKHATVTSNQLAEKEMQASANIAGQQRDAEFQVAERERDLAFTAKDKELDLKAKEKDTDRNIKAKKADLKAEQAAAKKKAV